VTDYIDPEIAVRNLDRQIDKAYASFTKWAEYGDDWSEPSWLIESCFIQLLAVAEYLGLSELRKMIHTEYTDSKESKRGFTASKVDPDGDPYSLALGRIRCFKQAIEQMFPGDEKTTVTKDLLQIVRDIHYTITDTSVFANAPENESTVHLRIEAVLKCVFPDLKHKPVLTKQIKNFEPDTGIASLKTLIEYKFLSRKQDIGPIADQLLADTRGYTSRDWTRYLYVIYETKRFRTEHDWRLFLRESGVPDNTTAVVLSGEPAARTRRNARKRKKTKKKSSKSVDAG